MTKPKDQNGLSTSAFGQGCDDVFSYSQFEELKEILKLAVQEKSMALITGQAGVGKTTATAAFVKELPANKYAINFCTQAVIKAKSENAEKIDGKLIKRVLDQREVN
jgi:ABC-type branched-subunit amino acid transport system ATPase component